MIDFKKIPPKIGYYLAGFADGEGAFMIMLRKSKDYRLGWKVSLSFNVSNRDKVILALFKRYLQCGTLRERKDGVWYFEVNNLNSIKENVIPFFKKYRFLSAKKKRDFSYFVKAFEIVESGEHLTKEGIEKLLSIRKKMNDGGKHRYDEGDVLGNLLRGSSEAIRQASRRQDPETGMSRRPADDDMVHPPGQPGAPEGDKP